MAMVALFVVGVIVIPVYKFSKAVMIRFHLSDVTFEKLCMLRNQSKISGATIARPAELSNRRAD